MLAKSLANQGQLDIALSWCEKAIKLDKLNPEHYHLQAVILLEKGELPDSIAALRRALYLDPNFIMAYFMLGNISWQNNKREDAVKYLENALQLLNQYDQEEVLSTSDGMTTGRLRDMINLMINREIPA